MSKKYRHYHLAMNVKNVKESWRLLLILPAYFYQMVNSSLVSLEVTFCYNLKQMTERERREAERDGRSGRNELREEATGDQENPSPSLISSSLD